MNAEKMGSGQSLSKVVQERSRGKPDTDHGQQRQMHMESEGRLRGNRRAAVALAKQHTMRQTAHKQFVCLLLTRLHLK